MSDVKFYEQSNIGELMWEEYQNGIQIRDYFLPFIKNNTSSFIKNVNTKVMILEIDKLLIPFTMNEEDYDNSYVCSPFNHYITYAKEELSMLNNPFLQFSLGKIIDGLGLVTKKVKINKVIYLNNWLISTNLSVHLTKEQIERIKRELILNFPDYLIGYRSVNNGLYLNMTKAFEESGFVNLPSRYVYVSSPDVMETSTKKVRNTLKRDEKLFSNPELEFITHEDFTDEDLKRVIPLYKQLYLDKYSYQNPQFTNEYVFETHKKHTLHYKGIRINGKLEGVFASKVFENMMANPIVGYNRSFPKEVGLYRMLRLLALKESIKHKRHYHQSAGVGRYKYDRGAVGYPEYTMIYVGHLSKFRQHFWKSLAFILNTYAIKIIEKKRL